MSLTVSQQRVLNTGVADAQRAESPGGTAVTTAEAAQTVAALMEQGVSAGDIRTALDSPEIDDATRRAFDSAMAERVGQAPPAGTPRVGGPAAQPNTPPTVDYSKAGAADFVAQRPAAGRELEQVRLAETQPVDINAGSAEEQQRARESLIAATPQINATAVLAGNSGSICGPASMVNGLILTDQGGNNARALAGLAQQANITPTERQQQALDNFARGQLSSEDVQHLQQLANRIGVLAETGAEPLPHINIQAIDLAVQQSEMQLTGPQRAAVEQFRRDPSRVTPQQVQHLRQIAFEAGLIDAPDQPLDPNPPHEMTSAGMAALMGGLRANGAFSNNDALTFHNSQMQTQDGTRFNHWTLDVNGRHYNSLSTTAGGTAQISDRAPSEVATDPTASNFEGRVALDQRDGTRTLRFEVPNREAPDTHTRMTYTAQSDRNEAWAGFYDSLVQATTGQRVTNRAMRVEWQVPTR